MKNLLLLIALFLSVFTFAQDANGDKKPKLEIRSSNTDNEIHRKTNDHKLERIDLKKEDRKDHTHKPTNERHHRPHLDGKHKEHRKEELKKERHHDKRKEHRQEKKQELLQQRKERRETKG